MPSGSPSSVGWAKARLRAVPTIFFVVPGDGAHGTGRVRVRRLCPPYDLSPGGRKLARLPCARLRLHILRRAFFFRLGGALAGDRQQHLPLAGGGLARFLALGGLW